MVNEARKQIMWAVNFRNMRTAVHGLYYGKDKRRVQEFARRMSKLNEIEGEYDPEEIDNVWDDFFAEYPDIQMIEEFNYRDIVDLPDGYEGVEIRDTIYKFVNRTSIDMYYESTRKQKMKFRKIVREAGKKVIPAANGCSIHDMGDCWIVTNKNGLNIGQCRTLIEAEDIAENADERTRMKLDLESTRKGRMRKIVKEADEGYDSDTPKIYVGTYAKYNDGSLGGKWVDLTAYDTYEDFLAAMHELHSDEDDPEFMVQDYENFPEKWYHEGGLPTEEEFDKINEYYMMDDGDKEAYEAFLDLNLWDDDSIETFLEKYEGHFNTPEDFGVHAVENFGMPENAEYYIDYEAFGRDLTMDWHRGDEDEKDAEGEPEDPDYYYDSEGYQQMEYGSDAEVGEQYIDDVGLDGLGKDAMDFYFDYDQYGRELLMTDFVEQDGFIFSNY